MQNDDKLVWPRSDLHRVIEARETIAAHMNEAAGRPDTRIGMFNAVDGRHGARLEIVLDVEEAEALVRYLTQIRRDAGKPALG